jgi:hypothetical protein
MGLVRNAFVGLVALAACSSSAQAGIFSGLLDGTYTYSRTKAKGFAIDSDQYTFHGALTYTFDNPGFGIQVEGSDDFYFAIKHNLAHLWSAGGSAFWRDDKGAIGITGSYFSVDAPAAPLFSGKKSIESGGFFGEWYALHSLTLEVRGGATSGPVGLASEFISGGFIWYESPDLALHSEVNFTAFTSGKDWADYNANIEYMPLHSVPMGIYLGYDHAIIAATGYSSTFYAGLKWHFGPGRSLIDYERTGSIEWTGNDIPGGNLKF